MGKWMFAGAFVGLLLPFGTTLIVTGNIQGTQYSRQQERVAAGSYRILLDQSGWDGWNYPEPGECGGDREGH